jgi:hypothetical protein
MVQELKLLRREYPDLEYREDGEWFRVPLIQLPPGIWNRDETPVCFQAPPGYPGNPPYGFCVPAGLRLSDGRLPNNYSEPVSTPFGGQWGKFSWQNDNWRPTGDVLSGSNLLNFVRTFHHRFREGY